MTIEITSTNITDRVVNISGIDVSDENLQRLERTRDDGFEREVDFSFDLREKDPNIYLNKFLHRQKAVKKILPTNGETITLKEALNATVGTITTINGKYREYDWAV